MTIRCCRPESHSADAHLGASVVRRHRSRFSAVRLGRLAETSPSTMEVVLASSDMNLPSHGSCNDAPSFDISLRSVAPGFFSASPDLYCCVRDVKDPAATSWRGDGRVKSQRVASDIFIRLRPILYIMWPRRCLHIDWLYSTHVHLFMWGHKDCVMCAYSTRVARSVPVSAKQTGQRRVAWLCGRSVPQYPISHPPLQ